MKPTMFKVFLLPPDVSCLWSCCPCAGSPARLLAVVTKVGKSLASNLNKKPKKKKTKKKYRKLIPEEISLDFAATAAV